MFTYSNRLQPAFQNLLQRVVRFFHPRSSCTMTYLSAYVQRLTLNASCMTISGERTKLYIFCCVTGFTSDFLSFIDVELIRFFHGAIQLSRISQFYLHTLHSIRKRNEPYLPLPSQLQLVLIYQPRRDGRLSRP